MKVTKLLGAGVLALVFTGCGGQGAKLPHAGEPATAPQTLAGLPFPQDKLLPGETLSASGHAIAPSSRDAQYDAARAASGINANSEFAVGSDRFSSFGSVVNLGQASQLASGAPGGKALSCAVYRLVLGGLQPGALSADVNLHLRGDGALSAYWVGVSDYAHSRWELHGPYTDAQVRLGLPAGNYVSGLGNTFIAIVAFDGAAVDVVGVGANPRSGDSTAPPTPAAFAATPVVGGLELDWSSVIAADLAGYRIYYSYSPFSAPTDNGVQTLGYLEGNTRHVLPLPVRLTFCAVASVDIDGNESPLSTIASAVPLGGSAPVVSLTTDVVSGETGVTANLTATGADSYDFDLNGDGNFEVTGNVSGTATVDTSQPGIIRPAVRGIVGGGSREAFGSVSLIVASNPPPVAVLTASDIAPVLGETGSSAVTFDASGSYDPLGGALTYAIDKEGDGTYVNLGAVSSATYSYSYSGVFLAKLRVTNTQGKTGYDSVDITARRFKTTTLDGSGLTGVSPSLAIIAGRPAVSYMDLGNNTLRYVRATDAEGRQWANPVVVDDPADMVGRYTSLAEVGGLPAIAYHDDTSSKLYYVLAVDANGATWNTPELIDPAVSIGNGDSLLVVNGFPAIAFPDSTDQWISFSRSTSANGYPAGTWATQRISFGGNEAAPVNLAIISGNPAVAFYDGVNMGLGYVRANDTSGTAWPSPIFINDPSLPFGAQIGGVQSLAEVAGHPALMFDNFDGTTGSIMYTRAATTGGMNAADWPAFITTGSDSHFGAVVSLKVINGHPAGAYYDYTNDSIRYQRALNVTGNSAAMWPFPETVDSYNVGLDCNLLDVGGLPMVGFYSGSMDLAFPQL